MRKLTGRTGFLLGAGENLRLLVWSWRKFEALGQELRENILSCLSKSLWYSFLILRYGVDRDRISGINGQLSVVVIPAKACGSASDHVTVPVRAISVIDQSKIRLPLLVES